MLKIDPDKLREYVRSHPDKTQRQIAGHFGCSRKGVSYALKLHSISYISKLKDRKDAISIDDLRKYVQEHPEATQLQIAHRFGRDQSSVSYLLRHHHIPYVNKQPKAPRITPVILQEYILDHPDAYLRQIAEIFNCPEYVIRKIIKQHRIAYVRKDCHGNPISSNLNQKKLSDYVRKHPKETQTKIAAHFGCDPSCVSRAIKKYDIPYVRYYSNNIDAKKLEEFARKNPFASARQIARTFDMPAVCVANALSRYGISEKKNVWKAEAIQAYIRTHPNTRKQEMARHFGVSPSAFSRRLKRYGIKF